MMEIDKSPIDSCVAAWEWMIYPEANSQVVWVLGLEAKTYHLALGETIEISDGVKLTIEEKEFSDRSPSDYSYIVTDGATAIKDTLVKGEFYTVWGKKIVFHNQEIPFQISVLENAYARIAA